MIARSNEAPRRARAPCLLASPERPGGSTRSAAPPGQARPPPEHQTPRIPSSTSRRLPPGGGIAGGRRRPALLAGRESGSGVERLLWRGRHRSAQPADPSASSKSSPARPSAARRTTTRPVGPRRVVTRAAPQPAAGEPGGAQRAAPGQHLALGVGFCRRRRRAGGRASATARHPAPRHQQSAARGCATILLFVVGISASPRGANAIHCS